MRELQGIIRRIGTSDPSFEARCALTLFRPSYEVDPSSGVVMAVREASRAVTGVEPPFMGMAGWLDSAIFGGAGIPSVIFGPGGGGAHADVEFVNLEDVYAVAGILARAAMIFTGGAEDRGRC